MVAARTVAFPEDRLRRIRRRWLREGPLSPVPRDSLGTTRALATPPPLPNSNQFDRKLGVILFSHVCRRSAARPNVRRRACEGSCCVLRLGSPPALLRLPPFLMGVRFGTVKGNREKRASPASPRSLSLRNQRRKRRLLLVASPSACVSVRRDATFSAVNERRNV